VGCCFSRRVEPSLSFPRFMAKLDCGIEDEEAEEYLREQMKLREGQIKPPEICG